MQNLIEKLNKLNNCLVGVIGCINQQTYKIKSSQQIVSADLQKGEDLKKYKGKTIRKRTDGRWWTRYTINGKVYAVYGKTQNECLQKLKTALRQICHNTIDYKQITLEQWLERWLTLYKVGKVKNTTIDKIRYLLRNFEPIAKKPLAKFTSIELQSFFNSIEYPRKREQLYITLKDAFTKAYKNKLITDNPFDNIEVAKSKKQRIIRALTHQEEQLFVEACKDYNQGDLYLLCLYQGLRIGEAVALTWKDIDLQNNTITINKAIDGAGELTTPKTDTSNRIIPLFAKAKAILPQGNAGNLFRYNRKVYQNAMLKLTKRLGLQNVSVHTLRHTFATRCSEAGIPPKVVQKWLGHSTIEMTLNVYTHVNRDFEQEMTYKFDTFFDTSFDTKRKKLH